MDIIFENGDITIDDKIAEIEAHPVAWRAVHFLWQGVSKSQLSGLVSRIQAVTQIDESYLFKWGAEDVFIICKGARREALQKIKLAVEGFYQEVVSEPVSATVFDMSIEWTAFEHFFEGRKRAVARQERAKASIRREMEEEKATLVFDYEGKVKENLGRKRMERQGTMALIANKDMFHVRLLASMLKGYSVIRATDGKDVLVKYFEQGPDVIFLDVDMGGVSGWSIYDKIKQHDPNAFIVMMTDSSSEEEVRKAISKGVEGYIVKPVVQKKVNAYLTKFWKTAPEHKQMRVI